MIVAWSRLNLEPDVSRCDQSRVPTIQWVELTADVSYRNHFIRISFTYFIYQVLVPGAVVVSITKNGFPAPQQQDSKIGTALGDWRNERGHNNNSMHEVNHCCCIGRWHEMLVQ